MVTSDVLYEVARQKISDELQYAELRQRDYEVGVNAKSGVFARIRRSIGVNLIALGEKIGGYDGHPDVRLSGLN